MQRRSMRKLLLQHGAYETYDVDYDDDEMMDVETQSNDVARSPSRLVSSSHVSTPFLYMHNSLLLHAPV